MPKKMERELLKQAIAKHLTGERKDAYVYGTMRKLGGSQNGKSPNEIVNKKRNN